MTFKELRKLSGMNIKIFSEYFDIPYRTIQNWDAGIRSCPEYLMELMTYKLEKEGVIKAKKYYVTRIREDRGFIDEYPEEFTDLERAKAAARDEQYIIERDNLKGASVEIRVYVEDIEDEDCTDFDYNTIEF